MNTTTHSAAIARPPHGGPGAAPRLPLAARGVIALLRSLQRGRLELQLPDGALLHLGDANAAQAPIALQVHDWKVFTAVLRRGGLGFAEAYFEGRWSCADLPGLLRLMLANRQALDRVLHGSLVGTVLDRLHHLLRRNTRAGSRDNIHVHYDIGNDFYGLWLDRSMTYSSALYLRPDMSLEQAQQAKLERVLGELQCRPGQRVLEIGCGWGSFAELAARRGLVVDAITLSREQLDYAAQRMHCAGLAGHARLHGIDYRDAASIAPAGGFDAVASIEMFEAVGEAYWGVWFRGLAQLLRPGGHACIQTIVIDDAAFERYRRGTDFIQRYIFPGGMLPSHRRFAEEARAAGLRLVREHRFGADYARTLASWRQGFLAALSQVRAQGFERRFERLWEFSLANCEAGFAEAYIDVVQYTLVRPVRS